MDRVVVVLRDLGVVQRVGRRRIVIAEVQGRRRAVVELAVIGLVVDIAAVLPVIGHRADGEVLGDRHVDEAFELPADGAVAEFVALHIVAAFERVELGLVGDEPDCAGQRTGAVQRPLRAGQRFDALHVIDVDIGRAGPGDRNIVQIVAHRGVGAAGGDDAAEVDRLAARPEARVGDRGQQVDDVGQSLDLPVCERLGADRLHGDGNALHIFRPARRGHDHLAKGARRWSGGAGILSGRRRRRRRRLIGGFSGKGQSGTGERRQDGCGQQLPH